MAVPALDAANLTFVLGELSGPPRRRQTPSGDELVEFDVTTRGESGTGSVPVAWFGAGAAADDLIAGSPVAVAGHVRRRFFRAGGATQSRTEVVAARVVVSGRASAIGRLKTQVAAMLTGAAPT